jgi:hypothetical protein
VRTRNRRRHSTFARPTGLWLCHALTLRVRLGTVASSEGVA